MERKGKRGENRQEGGGGRTITHTCEALLRGTTYSERGLAEVGCIRNHILPYYIVDEKQYVTKKYPDDLRDSEVGL